MGDFRFIPVPEIAIKKMKKGKNTHFSTLNFQCSMGANLPCGIMYQHADRIFPLSVSIIF
jgi:hypothetical protein